LECGIFAEIIQKIPLTMLLGTSFLYLKNSLIFAKKIKNRNKEKKLIGREQLNTYCQSS
jgi:hypothetical protein